MKEEQFYTQEEAADYLRVTKACLSAWRRQGKGPTYISIGRIMYRVKEVDAWLRLHTLDPAAGSRKQQETKAQNQAQAKRSPGGLTL